MLFRSGTAYSWGRNDNGQLGGILNYTGSVSSPVQVGSLTNWKKLYYGNSSTFSAAIKTDGTLWTWGGNGYGSLGNGNRITYSSPIQVGSLSNWKEISCGYGCMSGIADGYY